MAKLTVNLTDKQVKQSAISGLEYSIASIIQQVQLKFNVRITGLRLGKYRTQAEVQQLLAQQGV